MRNLRARFERFCYQNRHKGIPNLMFYVVIGSAIVYLLSMVNGGTILYEYLRFDKSAILQGQVWRLLTYVFTYTPGDGFLILIFLYFFYSLSRNVEYSMGTFRFNLYYFSGVILMDLFAMLYCPTGPVEVGGYLFSADAFTNSIYSNMAYYLHLSMLLTFATTNPNSQFLVFFIIPVKAWFMGLVYLVLVAISVFNLTFPIAFFPHNLFPLVALANYLLFAGKDVLNLFPFLSGHRVRRQKKTGPIPFQKEKTAPRPTVSYNHRCTVCGRTDVTDPELEFRYCSRCNGYYCYCQDHISNHSHIQ